MFKRIIEYQFSILKGFKRWIEQDHLILIARGPKNLQRTSIQFLDIHNQRICFWAFTLARKRMKRKSSRQDTSLAFKFSKLIITFKFHKTTRFCPSSPTRLGSQICSRIYLVDRKARIRLPRQSKQFINILFLFQIKFSSKQIYSKFPSNM